MSHRLNFLLLASVAALSISSCAYLRMLAPAEKPKLSYKSVRPRDLSFRSITLDFDFELQNPYAVGMKLVSLDYRLEVDGNPLLQGKSAEPITVAPKQASIVTLPYTIEFQRVAKALESLFSSRDKLPYRLEVVFGVDTPIGVIQVPARAEGDMPLPKLPEIAMGDVQLGSMGLTGAEVVFTLLVKNRSSFPLHLEGATYGVQLGGVPVTEGNARVPEVGAQQSAPVRIPVQLNFLKLGPQVAKMVKTKQLDYSLAGALDLGLLKKGFSMTGSQQL